PAPTDAGTQTAQFKLLPGEPLQFGAMCKVSGVMLYDCTCLGVTCTKGVPLDLPTVARWTIAPTYAAGGQAVRPWPDAGFVWAGTAGVSAASEDAMKAVDSMDGEKVLVRPPFVAEGEQGTGAATLD